jgi:SAM-dependent methyltransferase
MEQKRSREIQRYWNTQAEEFGADPRATTPDHWLREIEIAAVSGILRSLDDGSTILDIGCGNGYSTIRLATDHPAQRFVGGDYASAMIARARDALENADAHTRSRVRFEEMDVLSIGEDSAYHLVISDRCLINLPSFDLQRKAVDQIASALMPGGVYVAVENFLGPHDRLNEQRLALGLEPIPIRWHNTYLDEEQFLEYCRKHFEVTEVAPISSTYYLVTRLVYSKLCQLEGVEPGYDHPLYEISTSLPLFGDLGPIKLIRLDKRQT